MKMFQNANLLVFYRIIFWLDTALLSACFVLATINGFYGVEIFGDKQQLVFSVLTVLIVFFVIGFTISLKVIFDYKDFLNQLRIENKYALGQGSTFYDIHAFKNHVNRM